MVSQSPCSAAGLPPMLNPTLVLDSLRRLEQLHAQEEHRLQELLMLQQLLLASGSQTLNPRCAVLLVVAKPCFHPTVLRALGVNLCCPLQDISSSGSPQQPAARPTSDASISHSACQSWSWPMDAFSRICPARCQGAWNRVLHSQDWTHAQVCSWQAWQAICVQPPKPSMRISLSSHELQLQPRNRWGTDAEACLGAQASANHTAQAGLYSNCAAALP